ncbi:MAG: hybrid sensor histidine kinase/response regulator [Pedobacter sp.]|nr:hybrid sensor histidine kinase/response regulator [Pedobacter sp.]
MPAPYALLNYQRYNQRTQQALLALGVSSLKPGLSLLLAVLLVVSCAQPFQYGLAVAWLSLACTATSLGFYYCHYWNKQLQQENLPPAILRRAELWGCAYGAVVATLWGSSSQFMHPDQVSNLMIAMIYFGVCAGAAAISVLGMAHMGVGAVIGCLLFIQPLNEIFPHNWLWFSIMVGLYHIVILMSSWQRHQIVAKNLLLAQEQEALIHAQQREAERANKANQDKSAFLAAASHDLRQPVHAVMLLGHALQMKTRDEESRILVEQIITAGKALSDQFNSLMELSRLESGGYTLNIQSLALAEFLRRKLQAQQEVAASRGIALSGRLDWRLAQAALHSDISLLNRIIDNLLDNALKFSAAGSRVLLCAQLRRGQLRFAVLDQGSGIPLAEQENVFLPHVQLQNPTRERARGIGLGLSIVKEAALLLQADLQLRSAPGRGSNFWLTLPADMLTLHSVPLITPRRASMNQADELARLRGKQLLIVEDDLMVASALRTWAESWGMQVQHHAEPQKVPPQLAADLVICDIRLPGENDGIYWLSQWLADWPDAGGVLVSGESGDAVQERAEQEGLLLLAKPVDPDLLLQTLLSLKR